MKHFKLFFALFAMLALGVGNAWADDVTFSWAGSATADAGKTDYVVEQTPVTLTFAAGTAQNAPRTNKEGSVRMYANTTLTISCASGNITKVTFTPTSASYNATKLKYNGTALTSDEWTLSSPSNEVTLTASAAARFKTIVVTYTSGGGDEPPTPPTTYTIKWHTAVGTTTDVTLNEGATITKPATDPTMAGYEFMGWTEDCAVASDGDGFTAITDFGTADSDKDFYAVFAKATTSGGGGTTTETLKGSDVSYSGTSGYVNFTATTSSGTWSGKGNYNTKGYIQINKNSNNYHIGSPTFASNVTSIKITTTNNSAANRTFYICSSNSTAQPSSGNLGSHKTTITNESFTIDLTTDAKQFYIYSSGAVYISQIDVTFVGGTTTYSDYITTCASDIEFVELGDDFKWSAAEAEVTIDATDNVFPTLTNTHNVPVTYSSTDDAFASIAADGTVTLKKEGTVTITAKYEGGISAGTGKEYKAKEVTYSLKVNKAVAQPTGTMYVKVTDAVTDGEYLIVYEAGNVAFNGALTTLDAVSNTIQVEINSNTIAGNTEIDAATFTLASMTGGHSIQSKSGKYIGRTSNSNGMNTESSAIANVITFSDGAVKVAGSGSGSTTSLQYNASSGQTRFRYFTTTQKAIALYKKVDPNEVVAPAFTLTTGEYYGTQSVMITCATTDAKIYYTLDGNDPTDTSDEYTGGAITISETKTLKAIAIKGENKSEIAEATYTILAPLATMQEIYDKATAVDGTATPVEITFGNWVVSAVKEDGKTAFVTDGTRGFVIYDKDVNLGFSVGDILSGTAACKVQLYNGFAELTELKSNTVGLSVGSGGTITTQELDAAGIAALTGVNTGSLIKINGTCTSESSKYYVADVQIFTSLYDFGTLEVGAEYNITGIYQPYNTTKEMLPRSAADIEKVVGLPTATISIADITMEVGQEKTIDATITPEAAKTTVQYAITSGSEYITLDGTTITAVSVGEATITATIAEKADEYKGATKEFTVTVKPQNIAELPFEFTGGKADIENTLGMSQTGLGDDYNSAPKLRFNGADDNVIVHFDSQAGEFSFLLKQNGSNAGTFTVYESANGEDYTSVWSGGNIGNTKSETITPTLAESSRYVKFEYTTKGEDTNYALGSISIAKPDFRQEAGLAWSVESVILNQGDEFTAPTLSNDNGLTLTCSSTDESVATVTSEGVITLAGAIGTTTITASFAGNEYYKAAEVSCKITVNKAQLPTGTFALYSGDIVEGDYVITYENHAMKAADDDDSEQRLDFDEIAPVDNKINNPSSMIVWHILPSGEYWAIYNEYVEKYAASITATKNKATLVDEVNDNAKWSIAGPAIFDFINYERENSTTDNENKYLRKNNEYGFACYKNSTGGALTLYRKQTQHTVTVAACTNGSVSASVEHGATVLSGEIITLSNTPDAGYLLTEYNVYKTGDETVKVTVTDGTFMMPAFDVTISAIFELIPTITLGDGDNSAVIAANDGSVVNVQLNRSFTEGDGYYTLCLPFDIAASEIGTAYKLAAITKHVSGEEGGININLTSVSEIEAGVPYLVLPKTLTNPVFENVTINNIDPATKATITSGDGVKVTFTGIINGVDEQTDGSTEYYVGDNGYLYNGTVDKLGLRAFFTITDEAGSPTQIRARVVAGENGVTGVEDIITNDAPQKVIENGQLIIIRDGVKYNVQGQKL